MGTQGMVTVMRDKKVVMKVVAGCSGYNAMKLADSLRKLPNQTPQQVLDLASSVEFGCDSCCVVVTPTGIFPESLEIKPDSLYRTTFDQPKFNPRWECGMCDRIAGVVWPKDGSK